MKKTNNNNMIVHTPAEKPTAVVVLLGWYGSKLRHVQKYSKLYEDQGCTTITAHLDPTTIMLKRDRKIGKFVDVLVPQIANQLRPHEGIPLILHAFSNGGSVVIQSLEQRLESRTTKTGKTKKNDKTQDEDWELVQSRYRHGASIFDSAPAYISVKKILQATRAATSKPLVPILFTSLCGVYMQMRNISAICKRKPLFPIEFWNHWTDAPAHSAIQAYVYSTADVVTDTEKLAELVELRRSKNNQNVKTLVFDDSEHVQHLRKHPEEYTSFVIGVLNECCVNKQ